MEENKIKPVLNNSMKEHRARLGITQETLAKEVDSTRATICKYESGSAPDLITALKIAECFEVSIYDVFNLS